MKHTLATTAPAAAMGLALAAMGTAQAQQTGRSRALGEGGRVYKSHPRVYQLAVDRLSTAPDGILFLSSNAWDAYPAAAFGLRLT